MMTNEEKLTFDDLVDLITTTSNKGQKALDLIEEEYKEASDDSKA